MIGIVETMTNKPKTDEKIEYFAMTSAFLSPARLLGIRDLEQMQTTGS